MRFSRWERVHDCHFYFERSPGVEQLRGPQASWKVALQQDVWKPGWRVPEGAAPASPAQTAGKALLPRWSPVFRVPAWTPGCQSLNCLRKRHELYTWEEEAAYKGPSREAFQNDLRRWKKIKVPKVFIANRKYSLKNAKYKIFIIGQIF